MAGSLLRWLVCIRNVNRIPTEIINAALEVGSGTALLAELSYSIFMSCWNKTWCAGYMSSQVLIAVLVSIWKDPSCWWIFWENPPNPWIHLLMDSWWIWWILVDNPSVGGLSKRLFSSFKFFLVPIVNCLKFTIWKHTSHHLASSDFVRFPSVWMILNKKSKL